MAVPFKNLTKTQVDYLRAMEFGHLTQGWGGYNSTLTVRLLEERGLIRLARYPHIRNGRRTEQWRASLTQAGKDWLEASE